MLCSNLVRPINLDMTNELIEVTPNVLAIKNEVSPACISPGAVITPEFNYTVVWVFGSVISCVILLSLSLCVLFQFMLPVFVCFLAHLYSQ